MSLSGLAAAARANTFDVDAYDHEIGLVDTTRSSVEAAEPPERREPSQEPITRKLTADNLKGELARRKYAKWQADRAKDTANVTSNDGAGDSADEDAGGKTQPKPPKGTTHLKRLRGRAHVPKAKRATRQSRNQDTAIDILYENQRGAFFCGIPFYSAASLLQLDPAGWQNAHFQDSPVHITNAQVPDPSWMWSWKTWYVDMSHDVDDEGWEYSFAFGTKFSWHGSHPWFHSFVRRRRWLRKRVRIKSVKSEMQGGPQASHMMNQDYFTIHVGRDESPDSRVDQATNAPSALPARSDDDASDKDDDDVYNIYELVVALKKAKIDRQKISIVSSFLEHGEEELYYLAESMPEIVSLLIYPTSRAQLRSRLQESLDKVTKRPEESSQGDDTTFERRKQDLERALSAIKDNDDSCDILEESNKIDLEIHHKPSKIDTSWQPVDIEDEIKGIPESAGLSETGIRWAPGPASPGSVTSSKGKGRL